MYKFTLVQFCEQTGTNADRGLGNTVNSTGLWI